MMSNKIGLIKERRRNESKMRMILTKRIAIIFAPLVLLACDHVQPAQAILNCFTPNMFKMNKGGQPLVYNAGERANWYPSAAGYQQAGYGPQMGYAGQHPMKMLFQPKWKGGSLFGSKGWNTGWKVGPASNFYRPSYGYGSYGYGGTPNLIPSAAAAAGSGYLTPYSEQLQVAPFALPHQLGSYTSQGDGWSVPFSGYQPTQQQTNPGGAGYEGYTQPPSQLVQPGKQTDPYGTKGASTSSPGGSKLYTTTRNSILLAEGGYDFYDAHQRPIRNQSYGYAYPDWYTGAVDSPARIAQQLLKYGLRRQRLQQQQQSISAPLIQTSVSQFSILDEPRFVGFGTVDDISSRESRLSCAFNEAIDQTNRPLWVKFLGPYNSSQVINSRVVPPFNCVSSKCRTQEIESTKDFRYRFDNGPATSTLIITDPRISDYGIYRCSALTKTINNNPLETVYQIIRFGTLK